MQIDELVVSLVLDNSGFAKGQREATAAARKGAAEIADAAGKGEKAQTDAAAAIIAGLNRLAAAMEKGGEVGERQAKRTTEGNKKVASSFESAIRTGLTFLAVLAGARTVEQFTRQITALDAALGRTAQGMGQSPQALSALGKAVERMGGDFNGAVGGLRALSDAYQDFRTTGSSALIEPMTRLQALSGKAVLFGKDTLANFESIADALKALDDKGEHALADRLGRQILGSDDLTNLAKRGGAAVRAELAESRRHGVIDPKDVKAAQDLQNAYVGLSQSVVGLGTKIETALSPYLTKLLKQLDDLIEKHGSEWVAEFGAFLEKHKPEIEVFGKAVGDLATAAGSVTTAFTGQSPMVMALEAFSFLMAGKVLSAVTRVLSMMRALAAIPISPAIMAFLGYKGAEYLSNNTMSNIDPWADQSAGETAMRAADPGLADRVYGKRGEQLPHGPHHGVGTHAQPHDTRNLWQRTMPKALGGKDAPEGAPQRESPAERLRRAARGPGARIRDRVRGRAPAKKVTEDGRERVRSWMEFFQKDATDGGMGLPRDKAAAMVGMMQGESGQNLDPTKEYWDRNGPSGGTAAWHDVNGKGRLSDLKAFAQAQNKDWRDVGVQQQWWKHEAETTHRRAFEAVKAAPDGPSALRAGVKLFEVPADIPGETQKRLPNYDRIMRGDFDTNQPSRPITGSAAYHPDDERASRARGADIHYGARGHLSPVQYTKGGGENSLTRLYKDGALKVDLTDGSAAKISRVTVGHAGRQFLEAVHHAQQMTKHAATAQRSPSLMHGDPRAMAYHRSLADGARSALYHHNPVTTHIDRSTSSETKIGSLTVHTQAKDAQGLAGDLDAIYQRAAAAGRRNYGQA